MVWDARGEIGLALGVFVGYAVVAVLVARLLARAADLAPAEGRALAFNLGTRNSFVVLPIALTLPAEYAVAAAVVAAQSVVELGAMLAYLRWVPSRLFPGEA